MANIHIIGVTQTNDLVGAALHAVQQADAIIGSTRQLDIVKPHLLNKAETSLNQLPKLAELKSLINQLSNEPRKGQASAKQQSIAVLASGDPLYYGIGRWFSQHFDQAYLNFYPAISSIQMACHRLAISLQDVTVLSLHGRPLATLRTKLKKATKLLILTDKNSQPQALARECRDTGFEQSTITVLENLSYPHERIRTFSVEQLLATSANNGGLNEETSEEVTECGSENLAAIEENRFDSLHVSLIDVKGVGGVLPEFPGIPDTAYITGAQAGKGMLTKREVRLCILSLLQASNQDVIWDIGAGCGGVAVELAYWNDAATVYAIECHAERLAHLSANQQRFGVVKNLHIINGQAPECLTELPLPNKVFIGGSGGNMRALLETVWPLLPSGGLMVVSAVVQQTKQALADFAQELTLKEAALKEAALQNTVAQDAVVQNGVSTSLPLPATIDVVTVSVKRGQFTHTGLDYTPKLPVEVFKFKKA